MVADHDPEKKLVKTGCKVIARARYSIFQLVEVAVPRDLFGRIPQDDRGTMRGHPEMVLKSASEA
jgi:hypothetical protein